ncbi:MAG: response regulator [Granulosicoccus sp.]
MDILLVEDHRLVSDAMQVMLKEINPTSTITACYSTQHALSIVDSGRKFHLVLTDLLMPGIDGLGLLIGLKNRDKSVPIVIISGTDDDNHIRRAIDNGASGFIPKTLPADEVIACLKTIVHGGTCFPKRSISPTGSFQRVENNDASDLSSSNIKLGRKQRTVLQLMADGNSNKQISQIIGITEATVKYHTSQLFKLLDVRNRTSCVREAQQRGLINKFENQQNS